MLIAALGALKMKLVLLQYSLAFVLLVSFAALSGCRSNAPPAPPATDQTSRERVLGAQGGTLVYRVPSPPKTFNYLKAIDEPSLIVSFYLMGGRLVEFDHDTQRYVPGIAASWKLSSDARTVDVTLRDDARFSDGQPVAADDFVFTLRALYDRRTASPAFRDAMTIGGKEIKAKAAGADRLQLVFPEPVAAPESYLSNLAVLPRHVLEPDLQHGTIGDAYSITSDPKSIVTAGPFTAESAIPGERVTLRRNPHYRKKDAAGVSLPYLDRIVIEVVSDANAAITRLEQGSVDVYDRLRPADFAALLATPGSARAIDAGPGLATDHMWFNLNSSERNGKPVVNSMKRAWFSDVRFRQAISHAIDRESLAKATLQGLATPLYSFVSPGNRAWFVANLPKTTYDLGVARALLRDAGFTTRGSGGEQELYDRSGNRVEFTAIVPVESDARVAMATVIQQDLARLGIAMHVATLEFGELSRRLFQSFDYDAAVLGTSVTEPDPSSYANFLHSDSPSYQWFPSQPKPATEWETRLDSLVAEEEKETNPERRHDLFEQVQRLLAGQLPVIPIVSRHVLSGVAPGIGNARPSTMLPYSLWNAEELFIHERSKPLRVRQ